MDLKNNQLNEEETALLNAMPWLNEDKVEQTAMKQLMNGQRILGGGSDGAESSRAAGTGDG